MKGQALTLSFFFLTTAGFGYEIQDVLTHLQNKEQQIKELSFDFKQEITYQELDSVSEIQGRVELAGSNHLRIHKSSPQEQITVSNGQKVWVYNPAYKQVWVGRWSDWNKADVLSKGMVPLENYVASLKKDFNLELTQPTKENSSDLLWIKAVPKKKNSGYHLLLLVSTKDWLPHETHYLSDTSKVITQMSAFHINPNFPKKNFQFKPPPGTDVIPLN